MSTDEITAILSEMRDRQKESLDLQRQQFEFIRAQYDRAEAIQDKAERIQNKAASAMKIVMPMIIACLAALIAIAFLWCW